jgi:hypothetical protein
LVVIGCVGGDVDRLLMLRGRGDYGVIVAGVARTALF